MAEMFNPQNPEILELTRQRKLADLLTSQGMQTPQGQTVAGGIYVPPNPMEYIAKLYGTYLGTERNKELDAREIELAKALREQEVQDLTKFSELQYGGKQIPTEAQAGPMPNGGNIPIGTTLSEPNPMAAYQLAAKSQSPLLRQQLVEMLKGQKFAEGEVMQRLNPLTGKMETIGKGNEKYHAPISIDTGNSTILLDPITKQKIAEYPKAHQPVAGQVLETENGPVLVNTRTGQAQPIMSGGQPLAGGKPLTEAQGNATGFGMRAKEANQIAKTLENKGVTIPGVTSTVASGIAGMTPFVGDKYAEATKSLFNVLPEFAGGLNPEQQQNAQARKNFVSAVLRKESGAAISPQEYANEERKYFPQLGDSVSVIKQKQDARESAIKALEVQAGPGKRQIEQMGAPKKVVNFNDLP